MWHQEYGLLSSALASVESLSLQLMDFSLAFAVPNNF